MARKRKKNNRPDPGLEEWQAAQAALMEHPLFAPLLSRAWVVRREDDPLVASGEWAVVTSNGEVICSAAKHGAGEWVHAIAHCLLHLGFGHHREREDAAAWNLACDLAVERFLDHVLPGSGIGTRPPAYRFGFDELQSADPERLYEQIRRRGVPADYRSDLVFAARLRGRRGLDFEAALGAGLRQAVTRALEVASGERGEFAGRQATEKHPAERARQWFVSSFPLLASLAASFELVVDPDECRRNAVDVAAVDYAERKLYVNPFVALDDEELRFVMAHELLHVGLRHGARCGPRDPLLWNAACDYVINAWLVEMQVGTMPSIGLLYDPQLKDKSAEEIYDLIADHRRRYRKLAAKRGVNLGDFPVDDEWWRRPDGLSLDEFVRRALAEGAELHRSARRGFIPAGLTEEIQAQAQPPIPWDVELAQWFDAYFAPLETRRSFARPSRRQAATPDIPRPRTVPVEDAADGRTFGVVIDTSASMDKALLAKALGAVASYAASRDVPAARVVFCDAAAYDVGYVSPDDIAGRVRVKGRGGTVLQPGVDLLQQAEDFPRKAPILIITDGECDHVRPKRDHAYLIPPGAKLPFVPRGPVFEMSRD